MQGVVVEQILWIFCFFFHQFNDAEGISEHRLSPLISYSSDSQLLLSQAFGSDLTGT